MDPERGGGELGKSLAIRLLSISNSIWKKPAIYNEHIFVLLNLLISRSNSLERRRVA